MRKYQRANSAQGDRKAPSTSDNDTFIKKRATLNQKNPDLPETVQMKAEQALGGDFSNVGIHKNSEKAEQANASALTQGENVHFAPGKFNPGTEQGQELIGHELTHVQQQRQGRVAPTGNFNNEAINTDESLEQEADAGGKDVAKGETSNSFMYQNSNTEASANVSQFQDFYTVRTRTVAHIHSAPSSQGPSPAPGSTDVNQLYFNQNQDLALIDNSGDFLRVRGIAFRNGTAVGRRDGWIYRSETNLAQQSEPSQENLQAAQDLDDMLDQFIIPAFSTWENAVRVQGNAYLDFYRHIEAVFAAMNRDAQAEADRIAAILTVVCVGPLGFIGDLAVNSRPFKNILRAENNAIQRSEAIRGSIEDAIQTGIGEGIDILQGGWFTNRAHHETHPTEYLNNQIIHLSHIRQTVTQRIGATKAAIRRHHQPVDRANLLVNIYNWWNRSYLAAMPTTTSADRRAMSIEFERAFWARYILDVQVRDFDRAPNTYTHHRDENNDGRIQYRSYRIIPRALARRFDNSAINITQLAGVERWYEMYRYARADQSGDEGREIVEGSLNTQQVASWARGFTPRRFR